MRALRSGSFGLPRGGGHGRHDGRQHETTRDYCSTPRPLQYQTLWLVSSPDGHTRTSGRCLQAWRSTASPRAIFSFSHGVNESASTRPRHEGRRRCAGLLAHSPSLAQPRRRPMVRGLQASFGRVVPSLPVFVSIIHQSLHMEVCGVRLNFLSIPSPPVSVHLVAELSIHVGEQVVYISVGV